MKKKKKTLVSTISILVWVPLVESSTLVLIVTEEPTFPETFTGFLPLQMDRLSSRRTSQNIRLILIDTSNRLYTLG